jgi:uncharacterized protein with PQ loop repeat
VELSQFGWNAITVFFTGTLFFSFFGAIGLLNQQDRIWGYRSSKSVSTPWMICSFFIAVSTFIYGLDIFSLALLTNGVVRGFAHLGVLEGLWRTRGFTRSDKAFFALFVLAMFIMVQIDDKGSFFMVIGVTYALALATQPLKIWQKKDAGVVSIQLILIYLASSSFWVGYGIVIGELPIIAFAGTSVFFLAITVMLWCYYPKTPTETSGDDVKQIAPPPPWK